MRRLLCVCLVVGALVAGCSDGRDADGRLFAPPNGELPFDERMDIGTMGPEAVAAFGRVRDRLDAEYGDHEWSNVEGFARGPVRCTDGRNHGGFTSGVQGVAEGFSEVDMAVVRRVLEEELGPLGFTVFVDTSDEHAQSFYLYNPDQGGYVQAMWTMGREVIGLRFELGCLPGYDW